MRCLKFRRISGFLQNIRLNGYRVLVVLSLTQTGALLRLQFK